MMSRCRHRHLNTGIWLDAASQRSADDPPATANEELWKCTSIHDTTIWNDDWKRPVVNRLSHTVQEYTFYHTKTDY